MKRVEDISIKYIRQNTEVYARDVPLATARNIRGVRAVFGETYPDPVRVVSVGVPVEDLLADVQNPAWQSVSVEFCGGTHVDKTGDIKELVVVEESGIAKGIRRIIAVTGQQAYEVQRAAADFSAELDALEKMPFGPQKEQTAKQAQIALNNLSIAAVTKSELRARFAAISKGILDAQKAATKAENKRVLEAVAGRLTEDDPRAPSVVQLPYSGGVGKAITEALKQVSAKNKERAVYLLAADEGEGKVVHGCYMPDVSRLLFCAYLLSTTNISNRNHSSHHSPCLLTYVAPRLTPARTPSCRPKD